MKFHHVNMFFCIHVGNLFLEYLPLCLFCVCTQKTILKKLCYIQYLKISRRSRIIVSLPTVSLSLPKHSHKSLKIVCLYCAFLLPELTLGTLENTLDRSSESSAGSVQPFIQNSGNSDQIYLPLWMQYLKHFH